MKAKEYKTFSKCQSSLCVIQKKIQYLANGMNDTEIENLVIFFTDLFLCVYCACVCMEITKPILPKYRKSLKL